MGETREHNRSYGAISAISGRHPRRLERFQKVSTAWSSMMYLQVPLKKSFAQLLQVDSWLLQGSWLERCAREEASTWQNNENCSVIWRPFLDDSRGVFWPWYDDFLGRVPQEMQQFQSDSRRLTLYHILSFKLSHFTVISVPYPILRYYSIRVDLSV